MSLERWREGRGGEGRGGEGRGGREGGREGGMPVINIIIGSYREIAIAIESEAGDSLT